MCCAYLAKYKLKNIHLLGNVAKVFFLNKSLTLKFSMESKNIKNFKSCLFFIENKYIYNRHVTCDFIARNKIKSRIVVV